MEIDRRTWLGTLVAGAVLPACNNKDATPAPAAPPPPVASAGDAAVHADPMPAPEVVEATIAELAAKLAAKAETSASLVAKYRRRIEAMNTKGPELRAVLELDPEADTEARRLDGDRAAGKPQRPLSGIPILIKDNIDTAGGTMTTAGSLALAGLHAPKDAFVIAKLREAGAVILGKANLSEWANFRGNGSSSGWSARGGQCRNPYALDRSPSGSSSGSAVATAASLCAASLGSETDGSIVSPSSVCGVVGIKPTIGLVSRSGVIPISPSQDTVGPIARCVADAALLLTAIAGPDPDDPATAAAKPEDYMKALDAHALSGARLGVPRAGFFGVSRGVDAVMTGVLDKLKSLGAVLVDPVELPTPPELGPAEIDVLASEMQLAMAAYLRGRADANFRSLADLIAFNKQHADREMQFYGQELFEMALAKPTAEKSAAAARAKCVKLVREQLLDKLMAEHKLDAFVAATNGPPWLIDRVNGDAFGQSAAQLPAVAGYPHVTVPAGFYLGLPIGLSFFGKPFSESKLIGYAYAWEQAAKARKPPRYLSTVELDGV